MSGIRVELELDDGSFVTRMIHAGETVAQFNRNVGQTYVGVSKLAEGHRDLLGTLRDVSVLFGTAGAAVQNLRSMTTGWMGEIVKTNAEMQRTLTLLQGMSRAADPVKDAANQFAYLREMAKTSPFALETLTKTFVQLKATGIDPMKGSMTGLVNAVSAMGGSSEVMNRAALAMSQMAGKGVVQMEELRQQLGEAVPRAAELMARSMGVTYAELVKAVSTGTVEAKAALGLLNLEFERTFAGASADRMNSFEGLVARLGTSLYDLHIKAGQAGFFDAVQAQIRDLVEALNSPRASDFATRLGQGLTTLVGFARGAIDVVGRFKDEIIETGKWVGIAFVVSRGYAGLAALGTAISGVSSAITLAQARIAAWNIAVNGVNGPVQAAARNMTMLQAAALSLGPAFARVAVGVGAIGVAISTAMPYLPLIATAIMLAADAWSMFSSKTAKAREEMEKFGATSRKAVAEAYDAKIAKVAGQLAEAQDDAAYADKHWTGPLGKGLRDQAGGEVKRRADQLKFLQDKRAELMGQAELSEDDKVTQTLVRQVEDRVKILGKSYDADMIAMTRAHEKEQEELKAKNQSLTAINDAFQRDSRAKQRAFYTDQLAEFQRAIDDQLEIAMKAPLGSDEKRQARSNAAGLAVRYNEVQGQLKRFDETNPGIPSIAKAADEAKAIQKIKDLILSTQSSSAGMRAEIAGASSEAAKLLFELDNSDKIPRGNPAIEQLKDDLREAIGLNDDLQKRLQGHKDFERDLENALKQSMEKRFQAEHDGLSDIEKIGVKARAGFYGPLTGDVKSADTALSALKGSTTELATGLTRVQAAGAQVAASFKTAFGDGTKGALEAADAVLTRMGTNLERLKTLSGALDLAKPFTALGAGGAGQVGGFGLGGVSGQLTGQGNRDIDLAVRTVLAEARGEGDIGMQAVAEVIRNRAQRSGQSLAQIVTAPKQFSPWNTNEDRAKMMAESTDSAAYQNALRIVQSVMQGGSADVTGGATSFANPRTSDPVNQAGWIAAMRNKVTIGNHVFGEAGYGGRAIDRDGAPRFQSQTDLDKYLDAQIEDAKTKVAVANKAYADELKKLNLDAKSVLEDDDGTGSRMKSLRTSVTKEGDNDMNPDHKSWDDPYWAGLKKAAQAADEADKLAHENIAKRKKAKTAMEALDERLSDQGEAQARARKVLADPYSYRNSDGYQSQERASRRQYDDVVKGGDAAQIAEAESKRQQVLDTFVQQDIETKAAGLRKETDQINQSLTTEYQSRQQALANQLRLLDSYLEAYKAAGGTEVKTVEAIEAQKAALRQQAMAASPIYRQMQEFGDIFNNIEKASTGWISNFNNQLAQGVMKGKVNFTDLAKSIEGDIIKMGIQWVESALFKSLFGGGVSGSSGGLFGGLLGSSGAAAAVDSGLPNLSFGFFHSGGLIGSRPPSSGSVSPYAFAGAPRFHTGGMIKAMGIGPDEVPIIAKKGEGVFTPEQMAALGGQSASGGGGPGIISIAPNIQVNATGGTDVQNKDLAAQLGRHIDASTRQVVVDEIRKQMRPGGIMNR